MKYIFFSLMLFSSIQLNAQAFTFRNEGNKLLLENNGVTSTVSENTDPVSVIQYKLNLYYLEKGSGNKIVSYDPDAKTYKDIITIGMKSEKGYIVKSEIINMLSDTDEGKTYFTTKDTYNNNPVYLTWQYDLRTDKFLVIRDGQIAKVNKNNVIDVLLTGRDLTGNYTQKVTYNSLTHEIMKTEDKKYHQ